MLTVTPGPWYQKNIMAVKDTSPRVIPLNRIKDSRQCAIISGYESGERIPRLKELKKVRGNCYFTAGVSRELMDFAYRAVIQLGLREKKFLFSRGAVKKKGRSVKNACRVTEMDWDVGIEITIPHRLRYDRKIELVIEGEKQSFRLMELIVLSALMRIAGPGRPVRFYSDMAASVRAKGWGVYREGRPCRVELA